MEPGREAWEPEFEGGAGGSAVECCTVVVSVVDMVIDFRSVQIQENIEELSMLDSGLGKTKTAVAGGSSGADCTCGVAKLQLFHFPKMVEYKSSIFSFRYCIIFPYPNHN